jgi:hypothetical protein
VIPVVVVVNPILVHVLTVANMAIFLTTVAEDANLQSRAKMRRPPPAPMINVGKSELNFLFSVIHTTLNWG